MFRKAEHKFFEVVVCLLRLRGGEEEPVIDVLWVAQRDVGAVDVDCKNQISAAPFGQKLFDCANRRMDFVHIVAVVVVRDSVLALIAIDNAVVVYERNNQDRQIFPRPLALRRIGKIARNYSVDYIVCRHFAGVVSCRECDFLLRRTPDGLERDAEIVAPLFCLGKDALFQFGSVGVFFQEGVEIFRRVWNRERNAYALRIGGDGNRKPAVLEIDAFVPRVFPRFSAVERDRCPFVVEAVFVGTLQGYGFAARAEDVETPVEPPAFCVAQFGAERDCIAVD